MRIPEQWRRTGRGRTPTERPAKADFPAETPLSRVSGAPGGDLGPQNGAQRPAPIPSPGLRERLEGLDPGHVIHMVERLSGATRTTTAGELLASFGPDDFPSRAIGAARETPGGPTAWASVGEPIDPATAPAVCPERFTTGACRCCAHVVRLRRMLDEGEQRATLLRGLLGEALDAWERADRDLCEHEEGRQRDPRIAQTRREAGHA